VTNGPDVVASVFPGNSNASGPTASVSQAARIPLGRGREAAATPPFPEHASAWLRTAGRIRHVDLAPDRAHHRKRRVEGRNSSPRQSIIQGYARHLGPARRVSLRQRSPGIRYPCRRFAEARWNGVSGGGTAVTAAIPAYPGTCGRPLVASCVGNIRSYNPGLVWRLKPTRSKIAELRTRAYLLNLKLKSPSRGTRVRQRYDASASSTSPTLYSWQDIRDGTAQVIAKVQKVLFTEAGCSPSGGHQRAVLVAVAWRTDAPGGPVKASGVRRVRCRRAPLRTRARRLVRAEWGC